MTAILDLTATSDSFARGRDLIERAGFGARILLCADQLAPDFFDLSTGVAGEIAQACANYDLRLAIVAAERDGWSRAFREFARESGSRRGRIAFVETAADGAARLAG